MVTMATGVELSVPKARPIQYHFILWSIPVLTWIFLIGIFLLGRAPMVMLMQVEDPVRLNEVVQQLDFHNIAYEVTQRRIIRVEKAQRMRAVLLLAQKGFIDAGSGLSSRIWPPRGLLVAPEREMLQKELASAIVALSGDITDAYVNIHSNPSPAKTGNQHYSLVSVQLIGNESYSPDLIQKVHSMVSVCLPGLKPEEIILLDEQNKRLSAGFSRVQPDIPHAETQGNG